VTLVTGSSSTGGASSLGAADGSYYVVASAHGSTQFSASFFGVPTPRSLTLTYKGHASSSCIQNLNLWNWYWSSWVSVSNAGAGTADATTTATAPGLLSDYVFLGEVRMSVQCFRTDGATFSLSSDLLKLSYTT
jgi:hypothetical protein